MGGRRASLVRLCKFLEEAGQQGEKQHRVNMIVVPEEFLPLLGRKEVICFFLIHVTTITAMNKCP